jgi:apolipoprotein D and lipocalin family protein
MKNVIINNVFKKSFSFFVGILGLSACTNIPKGAVPVKDFQSDRYLGKWYEIARMDFRFEKGLNNTTANYTLNEDGSIRVENRGFDYKKSVWKQAIGKAKFTGTTNEARLKVSFFGPFYGSYNVIALDEYYRYALVAGKDLGYLWILSRETTIPDTIKESYLELAKSLGYDTEALIWVEQGKH